MEYHYQWPEYLDTTSSEGSGWESMCASPPPFCTDTPAMPSCISRVFPRGRPIRRRRLFPPPFNQFARGVRPQWSTPYYDCRYKWTPEPHVTKVCSPQFDTCYDYESLLDKTTTDKQPHTPVKKIRKIKGSSQQSKPVQVVRNSDQPLLGRNRTEWIENGHQSECNSPSGAARIGHQSSLGSPIDSLCKSPENQESSQSTFISVCNNESRKTKSSQKDFPVSIKVSAEGSEKYFAENGKEDMLTSIITRTILEASKDATNDCQDITDSYKNQLGEEPIEPCQGSCLINKSSDPSQNVTAGNSECFGSSQNISKNSYCDELFYSDSIANFPNDIAKETGLAVFNLQQVDQHLDSGAQDTRNGDQVFSSSQQNVCNEAKTINSLVVYDPLKLQQSVDESITVESESSINTTEVKSSSNAQFPKDNNSHPCSSEKEDSISSLVQQNQLLTDLLSQLISGDIDFQKNLFASNQLLPETGNSTGEVQINLTEGSIAECTSLLTVSGEDPVNKFQNFPVTDANVPAELPLPPLHAQEIIANNYSNEQSTNINVTNSPNFSDKITKACEVTPAATVDELTTNNALVIQTSDVSVPTETFPSNIDYPSSDSESNLREATLSSVTNYLLEEPLESFPDSLISVFDEESSLEILSSCVKPNSVLKVKKPRKRYVKTFESFKVKKKEKNICKTSSKCKKLTSKCLKVIRKCKHKICKEEERDSDKDYKDSNKGLRDAEVQVEESDIKTIMKEKVSNTRDAGTQWEDLENHCNSLQDTISFKKDLHGDYKCSNRTFATEEQSNTRERNNLIKNEDVLVMLVEIPLNLKKMSMETGNVKVEVLDNSKMQAKSNDLGQMASNKDRINESFATISTSKIGSFPINYDDSYEARPSTKSKRKYNQDIEASRSDHTTPISKPHQSKDLTKEISHVPRKLSESSATKTPDVYSGSDRVLRKRKAVNCSDPGPSKRKRLDIAESEVELANHKPTKKVKDRNFNTHLSGEDKNCWSRSNMLLRNRNSSEFYRDKQRRKGQRNQSQRPKSG